MGRPSHACPTWLLALASMTTLFLACGDESAPDGAGKQPASPAAKVCGLMADQLSSCGAATPCDDALVADCSEVVAIASDGYLESLAVCLESDGSPIACLGTAATGLEPTAAHRRFADKFCDSCLLGLPGCSDAFFAGDGSDAALAGNLVVAVRRRVGR